MITKKKQSGMIADKSPTLKLLPETEKMNILSLL
jgi:hypothetical protein